MKAFSQNASDLMRLNLLQTNGDTSNMNALIRAVEAAAKDPETAQRLLAAFDRDRENALSSVGTIDVYAAAEALPLLEILRQRVMAVANMKSNSPAGAVSE
jgi:hypothetical protein